MSGYAARYSGLPRIVTATRASSGESLTPKKAMRDNKDRLKRLELQMKEDEMKEEERIRKALEARRRERQVAMTVLKKGVKAHVSALSINKRILPPISAPTRLQNLTPVNNMITPEVVRPEHQRIKYLADQRLPVVQHDIKMTESELLQSIKELDAKIQSLRKSGATPRLFNNLISAQYNKNCNSMPLIPRQPLQIQQNSVDNNNNNNGDNGGDNIGSAELSKGLYQESPQRLPLVKNSFLNEPLQKIGGRPSFLKHSSEEAEVRNLPDIPMKKIDYNIKYRKPNSLLRRSIHRENTSRCDSTRNIENENRNSIDTIGFVGINNNADNTNNNIVDNLNRIKNEEKDTDEEDLALPIFMK